jgi:transposase
MTVPGVNLICAATFIAAIGDPHRFKRGSAAARWALAQKAARTAPTNNRR